ncbi:MAG: RagB/SusD family nutrient uptake outer membrane protein [Prevotella sp.]|nr:RagB/SusD family nutrient uptake outer membrane protein [Prevotella sp.]
MNYISNIFKGSAAFVMATMLVSCGDSFLSQDPLSFYEPSTTYSNEAGLKSALGMCDLELKTIIMDGNGNVIPMASNYIMSDIGLYAKTDMGGGFQDNFDAKLTPTSGMNGGGDANAMQRFWDEGYTGVKYANTVLSYVDKAQGLDETTRNIYKGRAYFHRALRYYYLTLQFGDIPLVTNIITKPKQDYKSTSKEAIFKMLVNDLEFAVKYVPSQSAMTDIGMVNKEACLHLLAKCYLVTGQYDKAEQTATDLISNYGLHLMENPFGTFVAGNQKTWPITRNVLWDLHRGENVCDPANKELIMPILNFNDQNFTGYSIMRACFAHWGNGVIKDPTGISPAGKNIARNNADYDENNDWVRSIGRGIGCFRTSKHYNQAIWNVDGTPDYQDLRHNRSVGNWVEMEDIRYTNKKSPYYGKNFQLYATQDYVDGTGKTIVHKGDLLCGDTIRSWYPTPLYQCYILDKTAEGNLGANQFNGASTGSNGNLYLFRLAETYLIRAEARFYQGNVTGAADDVNVVRKRANAKHLFTTVTIGDILDERARELYMEEWRQPEMTRVAWCLAKSGKPDEWGHTYDIKTWDKQEGTDRNGGNYWYQRLINYSLFNNGAIQSNGVSLEYKVNKHNIFWPIPNSAITANTGAALRQNYGYDGYSESTQMWTNWEDAVADENR